MKIAVVSSTTIPATLPDDKYFFTTYGSEVYNAVLVKGLADRGHDIGWFAPIKSTVFANYDNIDYYPTKDSKGQHLPSEHLENISLRPFRTRDLLNYDFIIDMSKQNHITAELSVYHDYHSYCQYKSGYQDWSSPRFGPKHFVTHCQYFADNFVKNGQPRPDVCRFGLPDFWNDGSEPLHDWVGEVVGQTTGYYLYPHRPSYQKGFNKLVAVATKLPDKQFVIATAAVFEDHKREMAELKRGGLPTNMKIVDVPENINYHKYRRALMRNATAILSPFTTSGGYMDTGGLISFEAIRCGCPVVVTRSPGSTEMLGSLDGSGVEFVGDDTDSLKQALKRDIPRPNIGVDWMPVSTFIDDYEAVMEKYK